MRAARQGCVCQNAMRPLALHLLPLHRLARQQYRTQAAAAAGFATDLEARLRDGHARAVHPTPIATTGAPDAHQARQDPSTGSRCEGPSRQPRVATREIRALLPCPHEAGPAGARVRRPTLSTDAHHHRAQRQQPQLRRVAGQNATCRPRQQPRRVHSRRLVGLQRSARRQPLHHLLHGLRSSYRLAPEP